MAGERDGNVMKNGHTLTTDHGNRCGTVPQDKDSPVARGGVGAVYSGFRGPRRHTLPVMLGDTVSEHARKGLVRLGMDGGSA